MLLTNKRIVLLAFVFILLSLIPLKAKEREEDALCIWNTTVIKKSFGKDNRWGAGKMLRTLAGDEYLTPEGEDYGFLLKHSTGNKNRDQEVDVPLTYADYYFLEALLRWT